MDNDDFVGGLNPALPTDKITTLPALSAALAFDVALESDSVENLCAKYELNPSQLQTLLDHPVFKQLVDNMRAEIVERGLTFKLKAKIQADMYLQEVHKIVTDERMPANVRADLIKSTVKWADLEPKNTEGGNGNQAFKLVINLPQTTKAAPITIESE